MAVRLGALPLPLPSSRRSQLALLLAAAAGALVGAWLLLRTADGGLAASAAAALSGRWSDGSGFVLSTQVRAFFTWTYNDETKQCEKHKYSDKSGRPADTLLTCQMTCGEPPLWPRPTGNCTFGKKSFVIHPDYITFEVDGGSSHEQSLLLAAGERARARLVALRPPAFGASQRGALPSLVHVGLALQPPAAATDATPLRLALDTDEAYALDVTSEEAGLTVRVAAATYFGVRHGLETLIQLAWWDGHSLRLLSEATVEDAPRFAYRGLMLDTARTFFPMASLRATVDAMAATKLNVFHWHLSDSHSFPFDSPSMPQMAADGAYAPDSIYSAEDVAGLVQFAMERGVRVLPEIDAPAHAANGWRWGEAAGLGALALCVNHPHWEKMCGQPPCGQLNPDNENTYAVLGRLYHELVELTEPTDLFHLGGDEVYPECWRQWLPNITTQEDFLERWQRFEERALAELQQAVRRASTPGGRHLNEQPRAILWSSGLTREAPLDPRSFIVQVWGASSWGEALQLTKAEFRVILSHVDAWYLDCGLGDYRSAGDSPCNTFHTWQHVYEHAPWHDTKSFPPHSRVMRAILGGEACLWTERSDAQVLDARLWPRAAALAERLWSDPSPLTGEAPAWQTAHPRLAVHRDRLLAWGVRADAVEPTWCQQNPGGCW